MKIFFLIMLAISSLASGKSVEVKLIDTDHETKKFTFFTTQQKWI